MTTKIYYYGSAFELATKVDDDTHRAVIQSYFDHVEKHGPATFWFDLAGGGNLSLHLAKDTPLAITTD